MSVFKMFQCLAENIPGAGLFVPAADQEVANAEEINLLSLGVKLHDIVGYCSDEALSSGKLEQRYFFLIPGKIVSSSQSFADSEVALRDALMEAWQGPVDGCSMDISPTFIVEIVNPRVFRVRNAGIVIPDIVPFSPDENGDYKLPALEPNEAQQSFSMRFQTPEAATTWANALMVERDHLYLPTLAARDVDFCKALHVAIWKGVVEKMNNYEDIRTIYYRSDRGSEWPEEVFITLYNIFSRFVPKGQMATCVPAFLETLAIMVSNVIVRIILLSWDITPEFMLAFEAYLRPLLDAEAARVEAEKVERASTDDKSTSLDSSASATSSVSIAATTSTPTFGNYFQSLMNSLAQSRLGEGVRPDMIAVLARHIEQLAVEPNFAKNADLLPRIYGLPECAGILSMGSLAHSKWIAEMHAGRGSVSFPVILTWAQAHLILQASPFCGYFFLDYAIEEDDVRRARATSLILPYSMTERFDAIHVNGDNTVDHAAHYIAYLEWDALQRGYEEYELKNKDNERLLQLVAEARNIYSVPICTASHLDLGSMSAAEVMQDFISQLLDKVDDEECKHIRCLHNVLGHWMSFTRAATGVAEVPRKAHLITLLILSSWLVSKQQSIDAGVTDVKSLPLLARLQSSTPTKSTSAAPSETSVLLARVTEGEDRALILAVASTDMVLTHSKRVHILYATAKELFRDFTRIQPYYAAVGISASMNDFTVNAQITYCLQRDLTQYYRDAVFMGRSPLADTLLFIHDVSDVQSSSPNSMYGKKDEVLSAPFREFLNVLATLPAEEAANPDLPLPPVFDDASAAAVLAPGIVGSQVEIGANKGSKKKEVTKTSPTEAIRSIAWGKAKLAWSEFGLMQSDQPMGYTKQGGTLVLLDAAGKPVPQKYSLGLECARYRILGLEPVINSKFYFQSLPYILSLYHEVFGLEDATLAETSNPGRDFLAQTLGVWTFNIPNDEAQKNYGALHQSSSQTRVNASAEGTSAPQNSLGSPPPSPQQDIGSPRSGSTDLVQSQCVKGLLMCELCDRFYRAYPATLEKADSWPSTVEHRRLVQFLENEELHTASGVQDFAVALRLVKKGQLIG